MDLKKCINLHKETWHTKGIENAIKMTMFNTKFGKTPLIIVYRGCLDIFKVKR